MITVLAFSKFIEVITAISLAFCTCIDRPYLSYCTEYVVDCVLDGESIDFCTASYIKDNIEIKGVKYERN